MAEPRAYYNEIDPYAAQWLRNLIAAGHIAPGDVDERDIRDVRPDDLRGYRQCHFFAGVGVWSYSLRRAGWPDHRPVWTASCPCQPFSAAGKGEGFDDERHLWPALHHLIRERRPDVVLGEQVASKDGLAWLDLVQSDMEGTNYAFGAIDTCSAGFGAPHIRQRLRFAAHRLANASRDGRADGAAINGSGGPIPGETESQFGIGDRRSFGQLANSTHGGWREQRGALEPGQVRHTDGGRDASGQLGFTDGTGLQPGREGSAALGYGRRIDAASGARSLADASGGQFPQPFGRAQGRDGDGSDCADHSHVPAIGHNCCPDDRPGPVNGFWRDSDWLYCRDGKWRPVEGGTFPLAHGDPARVGRLRAFGNAVDAEATTEFIGAYLDAEHLRLSLTSGVFA